MDIAHRMCCIEFEPVKGYKLPPPYFKIPRIDSGNLEVWWWQFITFDWFKLDTTHSMSYIHKAAIPDLRKRIEMAMNSNRPETEMSRIKEFYEPRRFDT